ncbi:MAG: hypothetical protein PUG48_04045 [Clostridia bacterium]|nr:hypothetical protein [Clostridia bacterium]
MHLFDCFSIAVDEFKKSFKIIILFFIILIMIYSIIISILSFSNAIGDALSSEINRIYAQNDVALRYTGISENDIDFLKSRNVKCVTGNNMAMRQITENSSVSNEKMLSSDFKPTIAILPVYISQSPELNPDSLTIDDMIISGRVWNDSDNKANSDGSFNFWSNSDFVQTFELEIGDIVDFKTSFSDKTIKLRLTGIYNADLMSKTVLDDVNNGEGFMYDYIMPIGVGYNLLENSEYTKRCQGSVYLNTPSDILTIKSQILDYGINIAGIETLEDLMGSLTMITNTFTSIAAILMATVTLIIYEMTSMILSSRKSFMGTLCAIGADDRILTGIFGVIIEIVIFISVIISSVLSVLMNNYISTIVCSLFGFENLYVNFDPMSPIIAFVLSNLFMLIPLFLMNRKIKKQDTVSLITNKE